MPSVARDLQQNDRPKESRGLWGIKDAKHGQGKSVLLTQQGMCAPNEKQLRVRSGRAFSSFQQLSSSDLKWAQSAFN